MSLKVKTKRIILMIILVIVYLYFQYSLPGIKWLDDITKEMIMGKSGVENTGTEDTLNPDGSEGKSETPTEQIPENQDKKTGKSTDASGRKKSYINEEGKTVKERILTPEGFKRVKAEAGSFAEYLRDLALKPHGSKVMYYNGGTKPLDVHEAVLDIDIGDRDLQQCADSVIRLRAEYLYGNGFFDRIHFNFTNGFRADYSEWMKGKRIKVSENKALWVEHGKVSNDYDSFREYLDMVFAYAGTLSLSKELKGIPLEEMQPGDLFIYGHTPGHCVIVMDMAENNSTGEKLFILAQGYMPAQDMHILKNPANNEGNPWYNASFGEKLITPEWEFTKDQLMRFED